MSDLTLAGLSDDVLALLPHGTKREWGEELARLVREHDDEDVNAEVDGRLMASLGRYVADVKAAHEKARQADRLIAIGYNGRVVLTPTLSVRNEDGSTQASLWWEASPQQFIDAVRREQSVVDGRSRSNGLRMKVVDMLQADDRLRALPTVQAVCEELGVDPQMLSLDELSA